MGGRGGCRGRANRRRPRCRASRRCRSSRSQTEQRHALGPKAIRGQEPCGCDRRDSRTRAGADRLAPAADNAARRRTRHALPGERPRQTMAGGARPGVAVGVGGIREWSRPDPGVCPLRGRSRLANARRTGTALVATAAITAGVVTWMLRPPPQPPPLVSRLAFALPDDQQFATAGRRVVAMSPDGTRLVYVANRQLHLRNLAELTDNPMSGTEGAGAVDCASAGRLEQLDQIAIGVEHVEHLAGQRPSGGIAGARGEGLRRLEDTGAGSA